MAHFHVPIGAYAHGPVVAVSPDDSVANVHALLEERNISAVPVIDAERSALGVISRTDLLRAGTPRPRERRSATILVDLPDKRAKDIMHPGVVALSEESTVAVAAARMVHDRIHRVFVTKDGALDRVFGTREVMMAIWESRVTTPIGEVMSKKPFTIPSDATLADATTRMEQAHAQGLVVVDEDEWPVGVFTQREALLARGDSASTPVELRMSHSLLCLNVKVPLYRAAANAAQTRARRVLVVNDKHVVGVVSGLDFARLARG